MSDDPVTPQVILTHMHAMEGRIVNGLRGEMKAMEKRIKAELTHAFTKAIDASARKVIHQIDAIDKRLDDVEIEIPKIKTFVGMPQ